MEARPSIELAEIATSTKVSGLLGR